MNCKKIFLANFGGLGNRMFRFMFATHLSRVAGGWQILAIIFQSGG
jgi:hypothetical protein